MARNETVQIDKAGERVDPGSLHTARKIWAVAGSVASAGDDPVDLTVARRTYQTAKAAQTAAVSGDEKIIIFDIPREVNGLRFRCRGVTEDTTVTYQVYAGTLGDGFRDADFNTDSEFDCDLAYLGQLAYVIGAQIAVDTLLHADTITITESDWTKRWLYPIGDGSTRPPTTITVADRIAEGGIDLEGADVIVAVPTVIGTDAELVLKGF